MNLPSVNRVEWSKAQELLIQLVHALTPFDENGGNPSDQFFSSANRFFAPVPKESPPLSSQHAVLLLTTLQKSQKEMTTLIQKLPTPTQPEAKPEAQEKREGRGGSPKLPSQGERESLVQQAQQLLKQVKTAIQTLSPTIPADPKMASLKETFHRLKPLIENLIQTASQGKSPAPKAPAKRERAEQREDVEISSTVIKKSVQKVDSHKDPQLSVKLDSQAGEPIKTFSKVERTSLPITPFIAHPSPISRKLKKKRKGLWFREEEDEKRET